MLPVCIDGRLLGTQRHLLLMAQKATWVDDHPNDAWKLTGTPAPLDRRSLDALLALGLVQLDLNVPDSYKRQVQVLTNAQQGTDSHGPQTIPWQRWMPVSKHQQFIRKIVSDVQRFLPSLPFDYYETAWTAGTHVLASLQRCNVDTTLLRELLVLNEGNVPALRSFEPPESDGVAAPVVYDRLKTLTGRLVVAAGPQILTLKRSHRRLLRSRYGSLGSIVSLDFAALEARILLYEHGQRCDDVDLYGMIGRELGYDRTLVKGAVISEMYGSGKHALGSRLGITGLALDTFVDRIQGYLKTPVLLQRLRQQYLRDGFLLNRYGRRIMVDDPRDHVLIAYYGQSTGVDVAMQGFASVLEQLAATASSAVPVFVLHDAIIVDVRNDQLDHVRKIDRVAVKGYEQPFMLKMDVIA